MAVFLVVGGLLSGAFWNSFFAPKPAGMVQERRATGGSALISQAEGAEIDSAALTPQSAPFIASADSGAQAPVPAENVDVLYGEAAVKDSGPVVKSTTTASTTSHASQPVASGVIYTVSSGDTLESIAAKFNVSIDMIVEFNPSVNFSLLAAGIPLVIPAQNNIAG